METFKKEGIPQTTEGDKIKAVSIKYGTIKFFNSIGKLQKYNEDNPEDRVRPIDP